VKHFRAAALLLVSLAFPISARAQNPLNLSTSSAQSPVSINSCTPIIATPPPTSPTPNPFAQLLTPRTSYGMRIQFTNESNKVADLVNFEVKSNGVQFIIRDVGTFSPGTEIDHKYRNGAGQAFVLPAFIPPDVTCRVLSVRFVDRTVWPAVVAAAETSNESDATLSATPATLAIPHDADSELLMISSSARVAGFNETDDCRGIAGISVSATAQRSAVYTVKPIAPGTCSVRITDEAGRRLTVPITVK
jgi:hypothetical protein